MHPWVSYHPGLYTSGVVSGILRFPLLPALASAKSGNVLESNLYRRVLFKQLGFGFADTEDAAAATHAATAAPTAGQEYPEADKECKRQYLPEDCTEVIVFLFVADRTVETCLVLFFLQEVAQAFRVRELLL